jgi:hypothetical protein
VECRTGRVKRAEEDVRTVLAIEHVGLGVEPAEGGSLSLFGVVLLSEARRVV